MRIVSESANENRDVEVSAGLLIIADNRILLAHPTNAKWKGTYSIPKGRLDKGERPIETAIRETSEEVGLVIDPSQVSDEDGIIEYTDNKGRVYKRVVYFVVYLDEMPDMKKRKLQKDEVDHAKFFKKSDAKDVIFWRFKPLLSYLE